MVSGLKTFAHKGCKNSVGKKLFMDFCFLFHLFTPFKRILVPTSQSPLSKLFIFSESLGKSNGMKWSQIWKIFAHEGCEIAAPKKDFFPANFALLEGFFWYRCYYLHWLRDSLSPV